MGKPPVVPGCSLLFLQSSRLVAAVVGGEGGKRQTAIVQVYADRAARDYLYLPRYLGRIIYSIGPGVLD